MLATTLFILTVSMSGSGVDSGKKVYKKTCMACHGTGAMGAPKLGDSTAWDPIINKGKPMLYFNALKGKGNMPPRGGRSTLTDAEVKAAVDYMVKSAQK